MAYVPDPDDAANPVLSTPAGTAQAEFIALKEKINNLFLLADYVPELLHQGLKAGLTYIASLPAGTHPGIMYGHAINITRNDIAGGGAQVVAAQLTAILGDNLDGYAKNISVFGAATEAWTGRVNSHAALIGFESSLISQYNANDMALVGIDIVFKNRNDLSAGGLTTAGAFITGGTYVINSVGTTDFTAIGASANTIGVIFTATGAGVGTGTASGSVAQGVGVNNYNKHSRAIQISSQQRSGSGELCGWSQGIMFTPGAFDYHYEGAAYIPAIALDVASFSDSPATTEPWTAYRISSALALSEYMSITWDKLQFLRSYCDSTNNRLVLLGIGNIPTTTPLLAYNYVTNQLELPTHAIGGVPAPATGSMRIRLNGINYYIAVTQA